MFFDELKQYDPEVYAACDEELHRQQHNIGMSSEDDHCGRVGLCACD